MTMTLDLRLAAIVQDLTVTALDLHMTIDTMVDLHLAAGIQDLLHTVATILLLNVCFVVLFVGT